MLKLPIIYGILFITNGRNEVGKLANYTKEQWNAKKGVLLERCFDCFAEYGLHGTGIRALAKHCGCTSNMLYTYFTSVVKIANLEENSQASCTATKLPSCVQLCHLPEAHLSNRFQSITEMS